MITDILSIIWKEWKEIVAQYRKIDINLLGRILALGIASVLPVIQGGDMWMSAPIVLMLSIWFPLLTVSDIVADTFAGERERHTLRTLLASRLSDSSILIGKIASSSIYGFINVIFMLCVGLISANLISMETGFAFYSPEILIGSLIIGLLISIATACTGVLISIKSPTVKQAQQTLGSAFIFVILGLFIVARSVPIDWWRVSSDAFISSLILYTSLILMLIDTGLFIIARNLFKRRRLMLI